MDWIDLWRAVLCLFGVDVKHGCKEPTDKRASGVQDVKPEDAMIPFDPTAPHFAWFNIWRGHIRKAKFNVNEREGYCHAAMIAQGQYVQYLALELARHKS